MEEMDLSQPHTYDPKMLSEWFSDENVIFWMGIESACHRAHQSGDQSTNLAYASSQDYGRARRAYNQAFINLLGFDPRSDDAPSDIDLSAVEAILCNEYLQQMAQEYKRIHAIYAKEVQKWHESLPARSSTKTPTGKVKVETTPVPLRLPQQTWPEMRAAGTAIADGRIGRRWLDVDGQIALRHVVDKQDLQVLLREGDTLQWWGLPSTHASLRDELEQLGIDGCFLFQFVVALALEETCHHVSLTLDQLIQLIGKSAEARRNSEHRDHWRRWVWRALLIFSNLSVIGVRRGRYKGDNGEVLDLTRRAEDCFISITGKEWDMQTSTDGSTPPQIVHYVCGPWLEPFRGNQQVLTEFADLRRLAQIPSGKPSGKWARSIGLCLNQRWRELANYSEVGRCGDNNRKTLHLKDRAGNERFFTRRELLLGDNLLRAEPDAEAILNGDNPGRACEYWTSAIEFLKQDYISSYIEQGNVSTTAPNWANAWLDQKIDIRPKRESVEDIAIIAKSGVAAKAKIKRTRTNTTPKP